MKHNTRDKNCPIIIALHTALLVNRGENIETTEFVSPHIYAIGNADYFFLRSNIRCSANTARLKSANLMNVRELSKQQEEQFTLGIDVSVRKFSELNNRNFLGTYLG